MSIYEELAEQAVAIAARINNIQTQCESKAQMVLQQLAARMGVPDGAMESVELDESLAPTERTKDISERPTLVHGPDHVWYFGMRIMYSKPGNPAWLTDTTILGIRADALPLTQIGLLMPGEQQEQLITSKEDLDNFLDRLFASTARRLQEGYARSRQRVGFTAGKD